MTDLNDRDKIREALEERGYPPEYINAALSFCDCMPALIALAFDVWADKVVQAVQEAAAELARMAEFGKLAESLEELADLADLDEAPPDSPAPVPPQKHQKIRPPRYIGPANKTAQRARRPPRVARSSCRKIRR